LSGLSRREGKNDENEDIGIRYDRGWSGAGDAMDEMRIVCSGWMDEVKTRRDVPLRHRRLSELA
jgi:hypothetical protein